MSLEVIKDLGTRKEGKSYRRWCLARCSFCGSIVERRTQQVKLHKSCGCATHLKANFKHDMSRTRQYKIWADIKTRCTNPNNSHYYLYGGRGITYDKRWEKFENFWEDMKEGYQDDLTIDRIDSDGNYIKDNCRWVTRTIQSTNRKPQFTYKEKPTDYGRTFRVIQDNNAVKIIKEKYTKLPRGAKKEYVEELAQKYNICLETAKNYCRGKQKSCK
jgi:hypothetical protein